MSWGHHLSKLVKFHLVLTHHLREVQPTYRNFLKWELPLESQISKCLSSYFVFIPLNISKNCICQSDGLTVFIYYIMVKSALGNRRCLPNQLNVYLVSDASSFSFSLIFKSNLNKNFNDYASLSISISQEGLVDKLWLKIYSFLKFKFNKYFLHTH